MSFLLCSPALQTSRGPCSPQTIWTMHRRCYWLQKPPAPSREMAKHTRAVKVWKIDRGFHLMNNPYWLILSLCFIGDETTFYDLHNDWSVLYHTTTIVLDFKNHIQQCPARYRVFRAWNVEIAFTDKFPCARVSTNGKYLICKPQGK